MARTKDFNEEEVLDKAIEIFWNKGYNGTSMQDLVEGLGISRSSMYDTYGDKHSLFVAALERYKNRAHKSMACLSENTPSAKEAIKKLLDLTTSEILKDNQHKGCFLVNAAVEVAAHDQEINKVICENDKAIEGFFYQAIKRGQENGEISTSHDAMALARFIINNITGLRVAAKSTTDKKIFTDILAVTMSVLD